MYFCGKVRLFSTKPIYVTLYIEQNNNKRKESKNK